MWSWASYLTAVFPPLQNRDNRINRTNLIQLMWRLNELIFVKCLVLCLAQTKRCLYKYLSNKWPGWFLKIVQAGICKRESPVMCLEKPKCRLALWSLVGYAYTTVVVHNEIDFTSEEPNLLIAAKRACLLEVRNDSSLMIGQVPIPQQVCPEHLSAWGLELCWVACRKQKHPLKCTFVHCMTSCWNGRRVTSSTWRFKQ